MNKFNIHTLQCPFGQTLSAWQKHEVHFAVHDGGQKIYYVHSRSYQRNYRKTLRSSFEEKLDFPCHLHRVCKTDSVPTEIVDSEITTKEHITYIELSTELTSLHGACDSPTIQSEPPGRLMSRPVKALMQVPCTSRI